MKEIPLTQGKVVLVDDEDFDWLNQWTWHLQISRGKPYARRSDHHAVMHRVIMNAPVGAEVDHVDSDGLNNQRANLRLATHLQNGHNRLLNTNNTSGFKGVDFSKRSGKWRARIRIGGGKHLHIGFFNDPQTAALAYDTAAIEHHGEFAATNRSLGLL